LILAEPARAKRGVGDLGYDWEGGVGGGRFDAFELDDGMGFDLDLGLQGGVFNLDFNVGLVSNRFWLDFLFQLISGCVSLGIGLALFSSFFGFDLLGRVLECR
jgi:hypothetical protein